MIFLILAVVVALIIFSFLRALFFPFLILLGIGWAINQFNGDTSAEKKYSENSYKNMPSPVASLALNEQEQFVCDQFSASSASYRDLAAQWAASEKEENGLNKKLLQDNLRGKIEKLLDERNKSIYSALKKTGFKVNGWPVLIDKVHYNDVINKGTIDLTLKIPCSPEIVMETQDITPDSTNQSGFASFKTGQVIKITGNLTSRSDKGGMTPSDIEWGGLTLWGPFGGLWGDSIFYSPRFKIDLKNVSFDTRAP